MHRQTLSVDTPGRALVDITRQVTEVVIGSGIDSGLCHLFILHTSASLLITENADPDVLHDLETVFARLGPDGDPDYRHTAEGPDDMSAHIRSALTQTSLCLPLDAGRLRLGTWQGIFLWEHRRRPHTRQIVVSVAG
ncbi:YjbQ family protein [Wenzhouxiangella sp. XN79A]|uniref:secondary thiamine-phosphate synthase enzyme YjbQ n=1 Tax=Wenzhouxiangella sp. XN79A TaxID=2724193 RepID=UPI00144ABB62|nr:secondary thiamine-phosphate synthase enzyme YjbQ [Wenzhouxiangella sp. XN79A]NKI33719.1 YjbQ family protein [Wenzhouxiangella sp. XN79A]